MGAHTRYHFASYLEKLAQCEVMKLKINIAKLETLGFKNIEEKYGHKILFWPL